jgi:hypothetical protein
LLLLRFLRRRGAARMTFVYNHFAGQQIQ